MRSGAGVAILDGFGLSEGQAQGLVARPLHPAMPLDVTLVAARNRVASRAVLALREGLEKAAAEGEYSLDAGDRSRPGARPSRPELAGRRRHARIG